MKTGFRFQALRYEILNRLKKNKGGSNTEESKLKKGCDSIVKLFPDSLKLKILSSDLVFVTLVKIVLNRRIFSASLTLFRID
jgi:hypothetical protein